MSACGLPNHIRFCARAGKEGGFAHVIEDESKFSRNSDFATDVLLGMLVSDLPLLGDGLGLQLCPLIGFFEELTG